MAELYDTQTNAFEEVPDSDVMALFQSGTFGFRRGELIPVIAPDGRTGTIPSDKAAEAFQSGFVYDTERQERLDRIEFEGRDLEAFLAGGARGATLGLSDVLLEKTGLVDKRTLEGLEEHEPGASLGGEIAGTALPLLIPEPTSSAGALARLGSLAVRTAGAPVRAVAKVGIRTRKAVEAGAEALNITNKPLKFAAEKIAARLAEGGTEGALFAGGRAISELALEEPDVLAEQTLSEMGAPVLLKAGEGAIFGALTAGAISGGAEASKKLMGPGFRFLRRKIEQATKRETLRSFAAERAAKSLGATKAQRRIIEERLGRKIFSDDELEIIGGFERMGRDLRNEGIVTGRDTVESSHGKILLRLNQLGKQIEDEYSTLDHVARTRTAGAQIEGIVPSAGPARGPSRLPNTADFDSFIRKEVLNPMASKPTLSSIHKRLSGFMDGWIERQGGSRKIEFGEIWKIRRELDDTINWKSVDASQYNVEAREMRNAMRKFTLDKADEAMTGVETGFADRFRELNRLYSSLSFAKTASDSGVAAGFGNRTISLTDMMAWGFTGAISSSWVAGLSAGAVNKFIVRERGNQILSAVADRMADLGILGIINRRAQFKMDTIVDSLVAGRRIPRDRVARAAVGIQGLLDNAPDVDPETIRAIGGDPTDSDAANAYRATVQELDRISADPERLTSRLADFSTEAVDLPGSAPNTYAALIERAMRAVEYLRTQAARPPNMPNLFAPEWSPTRLQMESFGRTLSAVDDPFSVLAELTTGFPSREGVDTLQAVYPALLDALSNRLLEEYSLTERRPPYDVRINLSRLLRLPLDPAAAPAFVRSMQQRSSSAESEEEAEPEPTPPGAPAVSPSAERLKSDRISERAGERLTSRTETNVGRVSNQ